MNSGEPSDQPSPVAAAVLVVDDEVLARAVLAEELRDAGYAVVEASSADEAVAVLLSDVVIALVVTDVRMPGSMDGVGLARLLRADYPSVWVLMMSSEPQALEVREAVDGFFQKPYDLLQVRARIQALL